MIPCATKGEIIRIKGFPNNDSFDENEYYAKLAIKTEDLLKDCATIRKEKRLKFNNEEIFI